MERTADQRRADLLAMLPVLALHALDGTTPGRGASHGAVVVNVHVPLATALGLSDAPGRMDGYGPVSAGTVRLLLPGARLRQVLVDEATGEVLHVAGRTSSASRPSRRPRPARQGRAASGQTGTQQPRSCNEVPEQVWAALRRALEGEPDVTDSPDRGQDGSRPGRLPDGTLRSALLRLVPDRPVLLDDAPEPQYRPSGPLARRVRTRDPHCSGLGCTRPSRHSELDHRDPWPVGPTSAANLHPLSKRCHRAKTFSWGLHRDSDGSSTWTSPTGRRYRTPSPWDPPPDLAEHRPAGPTEEDERPRWRVPETDGDLGRQLGDLRREDQRRSDSDAGADTDATTATATTTTTGTGTGTGTGAGTSTRLAARLLDDPPPF